MLFLLSLVLASVATQLHSAHATDDYLFVGNLSQYTTNGIPTPTLSGSAIGVTAVGRPSDDGILLFLSPDTKASLESAMNGSCAEVDSQCYQAAVDILENTDRVLGSHKSLEKRQYELIGAGAVAFAAVLFPLFYEKEEKWIPEPLKIPPAKLEDSLNLKTATAIVVVTDGPPKATVTAPPKQDKATGSPAVITPFASNGNGASAGDVEIKLDADVAAYLQNLLSSSDNRNCDMGRGFFPIRARDIALMNNVICGAKTILVNTVKEGVVPDWLLIEPEKLWWSEEDVLLAVKTVIWLMQAHIAQEAQIAQAAQAAQVAQVDQVAQANPAITGENSWETAALVAIMLSWLYVNVGMITETNIIPGARPTGGLSTTTECQKRTATQCGAQCGVFSWAPQFDCTTTCSTATGCNAQSTLTTTRTTTFPPAPTRWNFFLDAMGSR